MTLNQYDVINKYVFTGKGRKTLQKEYGFYLKQLQDTPQYVGEGWLTHKNYKWVELKSKVEICQKLLKL